MTRCAWVVMALLALQASASYAQGSEASWKACEGEDRDEAIAGCTAVIGTPGVPPRRLAHAYFTRGKALFRRTGDRDRAIEDFGKTLVIDPRHLGALYARANALRAAGEHQRAIEDFDRLVALVPDHADAFNNRGNSWRALRQNERALQDYERAIRLKPDHSIAHYNRGNVFIVKGEYQRAIADFDIVIRLDPRYDNAYISRCYARAIIGQLEQALPDCERILSERRYSADAREVRGFIHLKAGRLDAAIADYDVAIEINPRAATFYGRGLARQRNGDAAGGAADIAAAKAIQADIAEELARYGVR